MKLSSLKTEMRRQLNKIHRFLGRVVTVWIFCSRWTRALEMLEDVSIRRFHRASRVTTCWVSTRCCWWILSDEPGRNTCIYQRRGSGTCTRWRRTAESCNRESFISEENANFTRALTQGSVSFACSEGCEFKFHEYDSSKQIIFLLYWIINCLTWWL